MKNFMSIRKLYEDFNPEDAGQMPQVPAQVQSMDQMMAQEPIQPEEQIEAGAQEEPVEMPAVEEPKALPDFDPMNLTVAQFMERCDKINPLVCMGLKNFIEENGEALAAEVNGGESFDLDKEANLDFPPAEGTEQPADFSLDQPASDLNFPQTQNAQAIEM